MDRALIANWNKTVTDDDIVYCLGDFAMRTPKHFADRLKGKKILVIGNHDNYSQVVGCFDEVHEKLQIEIGGNIVNLSHYPYKVNVGPYDKKFLHKMMEDDGNWLIHGHVHNSAPKLVDKSINACVENWAYAPFSEEEVLKIMLDKQNAL